MISLSDCDFYHDEDGIITVRPITALNDPNVADHLHYLQRTDARNKALKYYGEDVFSRRSIDIWMETAVPNHIARLNRMWEYNKRADQEYMDATKPKD